MSLKVAITELEQDLANLGLGTPAQPREGSAEWFKMRAAALGLSFLRKMQQMGLETRPGPAEKFYRDSSRRVKREEDE